MMEAAQKVTERVITLTGALVGTLAFGTGFSLPPAHMPHFPSLFGNPAVVSELSLLATLNDSLRRTDRTPLVALPEMFAADFSLVATFAALLARTRATDPLTTSSDGA